jgi:hypothetical protein
MKLPYSARTPALSGISPPSPRQGRRDSRRFNGSELLGAEAFSGHARVSWDTSEKVLGRTVNGDARPTIRFREEFPQGLRGAGKGATPRRGDRFRLVSSLRGLRCLDPACRASRDRPHGICGRRQFTTSYGRVELRRARGLSRRRYLLASHSCALLDRERGVRGRADRRLAGRPGRALAVGEWLGRAAHDRRRARARPRGDRRTLRRRRRGAGADHRASARRRERW